MRWLLVLLLVGCAPDRVFTSVTYNDSDTSFTGATSRPKGDGNLSSFDFDQEPSWSYTIGGEWDWGGVWGGQRNMDWLHGHGIESRHPLPPMPPVVTPEPEHPEHSYWQEKIDQILTFSVGKLALVLVFIGGLAYLFRDKIRKRLGFKKEVIDEEGTTAD